MLADCSEDGAVLTYLKFQIGLTVKVKAFLFLYFRFLLLTLTEDDTGEAIPSKRFWFFIKHQRSAQTGVSSLKINGQCITDQKEEAEALNNQFWLTFSEGRSYSSEDVQQKCLSLIHI